MHGEGHETEGGVVGLFVNGGSIEMPAADIERFEAEEAIPQPAAPAAPAAIPAGSIAPSLDQAIRTTTAKYGLDPDFTRSLIPTEPAGNAPPLSPKGAAGLIQLIPAPANT